MHVLAIVQNISTRMDMMRGNIPSLLLIYFTWCNLEGDKGLIVKYMSWVDRGIFLLWISLIEYAYITGCRYDLKHWKLGIFLFSLMKSVPRHGMHFPILCFMWKIGITTVWHPFCLFSSFVPFLPLSQSSCSLPPTFRSTSLGAFFSSQRLFCLGPSLSFLPISLTSFS